MDASSVYEPNTSEPLILCVMHVIQRQRLSGLISYAPSTCKYCSLAGSGCILCTTSGSCWTVMRRGWRRGWSLSSPSISSWLGSCAGGGNAKRQEKMNETRLRLQILDDMKRASLAYMAAGNDNEHILATWRDKKKGTSWSLGLSNLGKVDYIGRRLSR